MKLLLCLFAACSFFAVSCTSYDCARGSVDFGFIGFSAAETDTVIRTRFPVGNNFVTPVDTVLLTRDNIGFRQDGDTLSPSSSIGDIGSLSGDFDYEFQIPATGNTFRISQLMEDQQSETKMLGGTKEMCVNQILACEINGVYMDLRKSQQIIYMRK